MPQIRKTEIGALFIALWLAPLAVQSVPVTWVGGSSGNWGGPSNWSPAAPQTGDEVLITDTGVVEMVTVDQNPELNSLTLSDGTAAPIADKVSLNNARVMTITGGGVVADGTIELNSTGTFTTLNFLGAQGLTGYGEVVMSDSTMNRFQTGANNLLTIGANLTIRGAGSVMGGSSTKGGFVNLGTIRATGVAQALTIDPGDLGFSQQGVLRAEGAGGLILSTGTFDLVNAVDVDSGSALTVQSSTLNNGAVNVATGGTATVKTSIWDGMTLNGEVDQENGTTATIKNGLALNGQWRMNSTGTGPTAMVFNGDQAVSGSGSIVLTDQNWNRLQPLSGTTVTFGNAVTVRGAGTVGYNGSGAIVNEGTIIAEGANTLTVQPSSIENRGLVVAQGAGGIRVLASDYVQTAGETRVETSFELSAARSLVLQGGLLKGGGEIFVDPSAINRGTVNNSGGTVSPGNSVGTLTLGKTNYTQRTGGLFIAELGGTGDGEYDVLDVFGTATLGGLLDVQLVGGFKPTVGDMFDVLLANAITGGFSNTIVDLGGFTFDIGYLGDAGREVVRLTTLTAVPLPTSFWLLLSAAAGLLTIGRKSRGTETH